MAELSMTLLKNWILFFTQNLFPKYPTQSPRSKDQIPACKSQFHLLPTYQQETMWLPRNVLVSRGRSDFFTLHFKAWKKHWLNNASICSAGRQKDRWAVSCLWASANQRGMVWFHWDPKIPCGVLLSSASCWSSVLASSAGSAALFSWSSSFPSSSAQVSLSLRLKSLMSTCCSGSGEQLLPGSFPCSSSLSPALSIATESVTKGAKVGGEDLSPYSLQKEEKAEHSFPFTAFNHRTANRCHPE